MNEIILKKSDSNIYDISVSLKAYNNLKDHSFQDMIVLPGSFYIEAAIEILKNEFGSADFELNKISFNNLCFISEEEIIIKSKIESNGNGYNIIFYDLNGNSDNLAKLSANISGKVSPGNTYENIKGKAFSSKEFYDLLERKKNQYGKSFRVLDNIVVDNSSAVAMINADKSPLKLTRIIDGASHLLSALAPENKSTYLLKSIDLCFVSSIPDNYDKIFTRLKERNNTSITGDVYYFNNKNEVVGKIENITLQFLEEKNEKLNINIAATYTADNLEESISFWGNELNLNSSVSFAPYNQIFQELLDPQSGFSENKNGFNVILINPEDWEKGNKGLSLKVSPQEKNELLQNISSHVLPNKIEIAQLNKYETEYVFKEIFADKSYLKHGIEVNDEDCIIDIGANIGLFSLFMEEQANNLKIFSFEPSPPVYQLLKANAKLYGTNIQTFNCGISDKTKTAEFTFYEKSSVFSGFETNTEEDREAIQAVVENMLKDNSIEDSGDIEKFVSEIMEDRLKSIKYTCQLKSVSDIIEENNIERIDLLKVDAEKSELGILQGIKDEHWNIINQIVIEVHDKIGDVISEIKNILTQKNFSFAIEEEKLLHNSGLYNIFAVKKSYKNNNKKSSSYLYETVNNFSEILASKAEKSKANYLIFLSPSSDDSNNLTAEIYNKLITSLNNLSNIFIFDHNELNRLYQVENIYDSESNKLGHIPYTKEYFTALSTFLIRKIVSIITPSRKVIVADCDNTLWEGVCGEDGALGIRIKNQHKILHKELLNQIEQGKIICLNSKNNEEDVWDVFEKNSEMILKKENIVASKLNWNSKADNLAELAKELNLGLDSFIFIDDNPLECAEIKAKHPEVLTIHISENYDESLIKNIWSFDKVSLTDEDKKRTQLYIQEKERKNFKQKVTLEDFINGLNLNIQIMDPLPENIARISQLTYRTNQFNFTTIRRSENEILQMLNSGTFNAKIIFVSDRFGDYGLVGLIIYSFEETSINVDTFLLSCRVLGRGVEYAIMSEIGIIAVENDKEKVTLKYNSTAKNQPALKFAERIGSQYRENKEHEIVFNFPADYLNELKYAPSANEYDEIEEGNNKLKIDTSIIDSEKLFRIINELNSPGNILKNIEAKEEERKLSQTEYIAPGSEVERKIAEIWQKVLSIKKVGINDNFFELGGSSLKGVQVIAQMKKEFNKEISIVNLFEYSTISKMKSFIEQNDQASEVSEESKSRGERRRDLISSRRERRKR